MKPLDFWRGERVVYGRRESGRFPCPVDAVQVARDPTPTHFRRMRERNAAAAKKNKNYKPDPPGLAAQSPRVSTPVWSPPHHE